MDQKLDRLLRVGAARPVISITAAHCVQLCGSAARQCARCTPQLSWPVNTAPAIIPAVCLTTDSKAARLRPCAACQLELCNRRHFLPRGLMKLQAYVTSSSASVSAVRCQKACFRFPWPELLLLPLLRLENLAAYGTVCGVSTN